MKILEVIKQFRIECRDTYQKQKKYGDRKICINKKERVFQYSIS